MSAKYEISRNQIFTIVIFCLITIILNVFLLIQNYNLSQLVSNSNQSAIINGMQILPLAGVDENGQNVKFTAVQEQKTLLLVYSSACRFCNQNAPNWKKILKSVQSNGKIRVLGVALGENEEKFLKTHKLENLFSVVNPSKNNQSTKPPFDITPQTILVNSEGKTEEVWSGLLTQSGLNEVLSKIN